MCTVITDGNIFGRTLDLEMSLGERVVKLPRGHAFEFKYEGKIASEYSIIGMAYLEGGVPLFFDGMNECGLAAAALNFKGFAHYGCALSNKRNLASYELIPRLLYSCKSVAECRRLLSDVNITNDAFSSSLPPTDLHWIVADKNEAFAKYYTVLAAAAVSNVMVHACVILTREGAVMANGSFIHPVEE